MFINAKLVGSGVDPSKYHAQTYARGSLDYRMSATAIREFWACPARWVAATLDEDGEKRYWQLPASKSVEWGSLFDCLLLTPELFKDRYVVRPQTYTVEKPKKDEPGEKAWNSNAGPCRAWVAKQEAAGKHVITHSTLHEVQQAVARFMADPVLATFVNESDKQVWVEAEYRDEDTHLTIPVGGLLDLVPRADSEFKKSLGDVKTTKYAGQGWERWAHQVGYEIQAAWYCDLMQAVDPWREILSFCFLLSENVPPYQTGKKMMTQDLIDPASDSGDIASGRRQYIEALKAYCRCLKTGVWPGYDDTDESVGGWTVVRPNPFDEQRRLFGPQFALPEDEP